MNQKLSRYQNAKKSVATAVKKVLGPKKPTGIRCPNCHCQDLLDDETRPMHVVKTVRGKGFIRRYRYCRHCGRRVRTREALDVQK